MTIRRLLVALLFLPLLGVLCSAQQVRIKRVPIKEVSPVSGQEMYVNYCAQCHGQSAKGDGPVTFAVNADPPDLTLLTKNHQGKFPEMYVAGVISGDQWLPAHGSKDMPMWGSLFRSLHGGASSPAEVHQRIHNLTDYVASLQEK